VGYSETERINLLNTVETIGRKNELDHEERKSVDSEGKKGREAGNQKSKNCWG
jgi:hypothetical protein